MTFLQQIKDKIVDLNKSIAEHEVKNARMHPESSGHALQRKRIRYLKQARDGLQSYADNMEVFWSLDEKGGPPAHDPNPRG